MTWSEVCVAGPTPRTPHWTSWTGSSPVLRQSPTTPPRPGTTRWGMREARLCVCTSSLYVCVCPFLMCVCLSDTALKLSPHVCFAGHFLFLPSSSRDTANHNAQLLSPHLPSTKGTCLRFWAHKPSSGQPPPPPLNATQGTIPNWCSSDACSLY